MESHSAGNDQWRGNEIHVPKLLSSEVGIMKFENVGLALWYWLITVAFIWCVVVYNGCV